MKTDVFSATMGDDSSIIREDGYLRVDSETASISYHSNLNVILLKTISGKVHVLDVNSGVILQTSCLSSQTGVNGIQYVPGADTVLYWDDKGVGARADYNGVLLLPTALQQPLGSMRPDIYVKIELVYSEAVLLYQCLQTLDILTPDAFNDVKKIFKDAIDGEQHKKGVKAQKWSTVVLEMSQAMFRLLANGVVSELKNQNRRIPALAIAAVIGQRASDLLQPRGKEARALSIASEAGRRETFKRWPHMDYKWALPAQMASAGFYHQPTNNGDDRAMCFTCLVCLVCWEKLDEPWVEHERHSPNCPFVRGEYTHNIPISVTNATGFAIPSPDISVVSRGNTGDLIATGTSEGKITIWKFDCGLKQSKSITISPYDSIFSSVLAPPGSNKVWTDCLEKDNYVYQLNLTAMAFIGLTPEPTFPNSQTILETTERDSSSAKKAKPSLIAAVRIIRTEVSSSEPPVEQNVAEKELFNSGASSESIEAMNNENEAKSSVIYSERLLFLLTYDIHGSSEMPAIAIIPTSKTTTKAGGSKKVTSAMPRPEEANIYDEIFFHQYSDDELDIPQVPNNLDEHINVINLNASSSKDDDKYWEPKKIIFTKHYKVYTSAAAAAAAPCLLSSGPQNSVTVFQENGENNFKEMVSKLSSLKKNWKTNLDTSEGTKIADQTDAAVMKADDFAQIFSMNGAFQVSDLKWYETQGNDKVKVEYSMKSSGAQTSTNGNNEGFDSETVPEETVPACVAVHCLSLPNHLVLDYNARVTHLVPTPDKTFLLVVVSSAVADVDAQNSEPARMDVDEMYISDELETLCGKKLDTKPSSSVCGKAYMLMYKIKSDESVFTLNESPTLIRNLTLEESPVDLCMIPPGKTVKSSLACVGSDGIFRLYSLPEMKLLSEKSATQGHFVSLTYISTVERISVCTKDGTMHFYALNNNENDDHEDEEDETFLVSDSKFLSSSQDVFIANKQNLSIEDMKKLLTLSGLYGTNIAVPYSAVVPGFWCELSPAQRPRSDPQTSKTWRLQNTSSSWDEHVLELTLPYAMTLAHVEINFTLHNIYGTPPVIQVSLLKQNLHGIGYKKDLSQPPGEGNSPMIDSDMPSYQENPVHNIEYLRAHNAELLAGPVLLASGLDLTQQSGTLSLTSPRLYRVTGRTFLVHMKTLFNPARDMSYNDKATQTGGKTIKSEIIGCDWLHQISISVRASPQTEIPMERQQRIVMLESDQFLERLFEIAKDFRDVEKRDIALDLLLWVVSVKLQRIRLPISPIPEEQEEATPVELQQMECVRIIETHLEDLIKNCILCSNRSVAKKAVKIIITSLEGMKNLPRPWRSTLDQTLLHCIQITLPLLGACQSPGAMKWFITLAMHATVQERVKEVSVICMKILEELAKCLDSRTNVFHNLLRARYGLYGLPLERHIFDMEGPALNKGSAAPVTYASVLSGDTGSAAGSKSDHQLKDLYNLASDLDGKVAHSGLEWWNETAGVGVFGSGLNEAMPLHLLCHSASDGTKLEQLGGRQQPAVINSLPGDPTQLISTMKESLAKPSAVDSDSLEDGENSSLMECDSQEKPDDDKMFKEQDSCGIPWQQLVARPPQYTLIVERMHSGARRYVVLDFGHPVRLTDVIIPSCSDLVTLSIDIWLNGEDQDNTKLAFATDISTKNLVLTDIQPPPLCRYVKITTIGRYGMSAMRCKIPLGWFYGHISEIANEQASRNALSALTQDLLCRFRLATGKLMSLLDPYLHVYNGNASHMVAFLNKNSEADPKVLAAYHECIELQQQLHTVGIVMKSLRNSTELDKEARELANVGRVSIEAILRKASTDKLRVMAEGMVDMLLYLFFEIGEVKVEVSATWCSQVSKLLEWCAPRAAAALGTLLARCCGPATWWGRHLADTLEQAFLAADSMPVSQDRILVLVMYMARKSLLACGSYDGGPAEAFALRALFLLRATNPEPSVTAAMLVALAAVLDSAPNTSNGWSRWDFVTGGRPGGGAADAMTSPSQRAPLSDCKAHRRKMSHLQRMYYSEHIETIKKIGKDQLDKDRIKLKAARMAALYKRAGGLSPPGSRHDGDPPPELPAPRLITAPVARDLAKALVNYILAMDSATNTDMMILCAKVVGRLCASAGGGGLIEPQSLLGLARRSATLPSWPRHALTTLLQDLVEYENLESASSSSSSSESGSSWPPPRVIRVSQDDNIAFSKTLSKKPSVIKLCGGTPTPDGQLTLVVEAEDSDPEEKLDSTISACVDARLESGAEVWGETGARRLLLLGAGVLAAAVRAPPPVCARAADDAPPRPHPPLNHTLYDVFRQLALEFDEQDDCSFVENVVSLWLTLNGSTWAASGGLWANASLVTPANGPKIRMSSDTINALLASLVHLEHVSLRCWVLSMQALAWIANLPLQGVGSPLLVVPGAKDSHCHTALQCIGCHKLICFQDDQTEGYTQTMGRVIQECEFFVPAIVRYVTMNITNDNSVSSCDSYLGGSCVGAGAAAASALQSVLQRVLSGRGASQAACAALRCICGVWRRDARPGNAYDLQAALLRTSAPLLHLLTARHAQHAVSLLDTVAYMACEWMGACGEGGNSSDGAASGEATLSLLLADVLGSGVSSAPSRRSPNRRTVLAQLLQLSRRLLAIPLSSASEHTSPQRTPMDESQTDESKATQQQNDEAINMDDERKQHVPKTPYLADTVLQHRPTMQRLYKTLSLCQGVNMTVPLPIGINMDLPPCEPSSVRDEVFWLVSYMAEIATHPNLVVSSLLEFLKKKENLALSHTLVRFIMRILEKPDALESFIELDGLEIITDKLIACHKTQLSQNNGLVSSLMNYLKLPPQLINMSTPAGKKNTNQPPAVETINGLINFAPLCTVECGNPTAQAADVLLGGGTTNGGNNACAARRVRAAAWSYHFFSVDDTSQALTLTLPYAIQLHEIQLQPHLTSLATCPGAVAVEAGCGGTFAPLGPPQNTVGMTYIRLVLSQPIIATTVQIRLYKPRDSSNMGLLQLRVLGTPAFTKNSSTLNYFSKSWCGWSRVLAMCLRGPLPASRWACVTGGEALDACVALVGSAASRHANAVVLAAAKHCPQVRARLVMAVLGMDGLAHAQAYHSNNHGDNNAAINALCELLFDLCTIATDGSLQTYLGWLTDSALKCLRTKIPVSSAYIQTLAYVLWTLKERNTEMLTQLVTDDLFEIVFAWVREVPDTNLLKKALDSVLCSICFIRPQLYKYILQHLNLFPSMDDDTPGIYSMEGLTDDRKVSDVEGDSQSRVLANISKSQLETVAAVAMTTETIPVLLQSSLPTAVVHAITQFCITGLQNLKSNTPEDTQMTDADKAKDQGMIIDYSEECVPLTMMPVLIDWLKSLCMSRQLKDWLGTTASGFWGPLLLLLCKSKHEYKTWEESEQFVMLEEKTIQLFAELTTCHPGNQKLFASTLHNILESMHYSEGEGISAFSRALILRLLLSSERGRVALRWADGGLGAGDATPGRHPAVHAHKVVDAPLHCTVRQLLRDHRPPVSATITLPGGCGGPSSTISVQRSASDTAILTSVEAWELSVAAASSAKDKRAKDAKNTSIKQQKNKKWVALKGSANVPDQSASDDVIDSAVRVEADGIEGYISPNVTLGQLAAANPHVFGPHISLTLHHASKNDPSPTWEGDSATKSGIPEGGGAVLREFGACGGLALVAARLPRPHAPSAPPPHQPPQPDLDWVKIDDFYDEVAERLSCGTVTEESICTGVPPHSLIVLGLLLKLPGYAEALLNEGPRAVHLLRLLLGVTDDEDGKNILVGVSPNSPSGSEWSLGTLPFRVVSSLLEAAPRSTDDGRLLRRLLLAIGAVRLLLACLAVFTHHQPDTPPEQSQGSNGSSSRSKADDKSKQLYWAKGTGYGTGSIQQSWNVEQALVRQKTEEEHVTVLLQVLASYMNPGEQWPPDKPPEAQPDGEQHELPPEFIELIVNSSLVPAICSYLRNDSVLDMSRHIPLYMCVLRSARALWSVRCKAITQALKPLPRLLKQMSHTTNSYASKLKMNKKGLHGKMTYSQRFSTPSGSEMSEEDEGLAKLIMDIQATALVMADICGEDETATGGVPRPVTGATREARYIEVMKRLQFETFEMIEECGENGYKFSVSYHFAGTVRAAGERSHPTRMKRLAQEAATLSTSLPLSYSSSVFVRTDTDRLDVMKVLITGPSDTPYANGCFVLDVYFPADYPSVPMLINLETTGRHSVRFNPNLYNDGKVCLSVLNTWHGRPEEKWNAHTSSFLQVLVSIQSLILVPEPYFNEPGYERSRGTKVGTNASIEYNSNIYQACVRWAMLDHLRSPSPCFKEVIQTHFWIKRNEIVQTIANWITELESQPGDKRTQRSISVNLMALKRHYLKLQEELAKLQTPPGLEDLEEPFVLPAPPQVSPSKPPSPPSPPSPPAPQDPQNTDEMEQDVLEKIVSQVLD